jgi:microcystin-dependent protein
MAFWKWSRTASSNASADSSVNWAEGMAPSAVNDSARAMMARLAEWRDDVSGTITTGGTSTAYTLASNQGFTSTGVMIGALIAFIPHATNGATVTLNVDGTGNQALRYGPGLELQSGMLIQGTPYVATFAADGSFYLRNFTANPYGIPLGGLLPYIGSSAPNSAFVLPFGQAINRVTYATLFALVGTTFGVGDGSTTFNVPDLRGRSVFGLDNMGGSAASRITVAGGNFDGTVRGAAGGAENHTLTTPEIPSHSHSVTDPGHTHALNPNPTGFIGSGPGGASPGGASLSGATVVSATTGISVQNTGGGGSHTVLSPAMVLPYILRVI